MTPIANYSDAFIKFLIIAVFCLFLLAFLLPTDIKAQDSVSLKVMRIETAEGKKYIWLKDIKTKNRFITICECDKLPADVIKGNAIKVPADRIIVIKDSYRKRDLEN